MAGLPKIDWANVLRSVYDPSSSSIRTNAQVTIPSGSIELAIDASTDNIRIGDGVSLNTLSSIGDRVGIDVNVLGGSISGNVSGTFTQTGFSGGLVTTKM